MASFRITHREFNCFKETDSIDELSENLDAAFHSYLDKAKEITPEEEFWAHCSNLQVWYENTYNTKLIHSNLSFPLLKKLSDVGDSLAKQVFKEEIAKRVLSGYLSVVKYLDERYYLKYLKRIQYDNNISQ